MDFPILINWMSLLSFLGSSGVTFHFSMKFMSANRIAPDGTPRFCCVSSWATMFAYVPQKDTRLMWVKIDLAKYFDEKIKAFGSFLDKHITILIISFKHSSILL